MKRTLKQLGVVALGVGAGFGAVGWAVTDFELVAIAAGLGVAGGWRPWETYRRWRDGS